MLGRAVLPAATFPIEHGYHPVSDPELIARPTTSLLRATISPCN